MEADEKRTTEDLKIMQMILRYDGFFKNTNADIGLTRKHVWIFYEYDREYQCCNSFFRFQTAEELKRIIAGMIAEDFNILIENTTENIHHSIKEIDMEDAEQKDYSACIPELLSNIEVLNSEMQKSAGMLDTIFQALSNILKE
ncbi:MAG: hypothetical protein HFI75_14620 [Lachnospiraceae bacterium]|nr:hypothetical protein [Lachnospiraceae bacterium]